MIHKRNTVVGVVNETGIHRIVFELNRDPFDHGCGLSLSCIVIVKGGFDFANGIATTRDLNHLCSGTTVVYLVDRGRNRIRGTAIEVVRGIHTVRFQKREENDPQWPFPAPIPRRKRDQRGPFGGEA